MEIKIYRNGSESARFDTGEQTVYQAQLMGEHKIVAKFLSYSVLDIELGDYIDHRGERFYINQLPSVIKRSNSAYEYSVNFEGEIYRLYNKLFMHEGATDFAYFGDAEALLDLIITNINSTDPGWTMGDVEATEGQSLRFSDDTCRTALTKIADAFKLEFALSVKQISLVKSVGNDTLLSFEYGKGKGLYELTRNAVDDKNVVTRVYAFGGEKNISADYRDGLKKLVFEDRYLESNTAKYGIIEGVVNFPDIYPHRTGTVTATAEINRVNDSAIDFDINNYLLEGVAPSIVFKTGDLAGSEFEITNYNAITKEIRFNPVTEANDYQLPNENFKPSVGDTYTLVNIKMPASYEEAAEATLKAAAQEWLDENDHPRRAYQLNIDRFHAADIGAEIHIGDKVNVKDTPLGVDNTIRAIGISYPLIDPFRITAVIADFVGYSAQEIAIAKGIDNTREIVRVDRTRSEASRRNAMRYRQLQGLIFDPDGYFDTENIKPGSIESLMLSVGARSQNFSLSGVRIYPNHDGDANALRISSGELIHHEIELEGLGDTWAMTAATFDELDAADPYYVFAKCSKSQLTGTWEISKTPVKAEDIPGFYAFNLGVLYAVADGRRDFAFTNGMTFISGENITTGRIQDLSGQNFFDLTDGKFNLGDNTRGIDWSVTTPNRLTIRGGLVANAGGITAPMGVNRGAYDPAATYYEGDTLTFEGSLWRVIATTPISGITPAEGVNYTVEVQKGATGLGTNVRVIYRKNDDAENAPALDVNDPDPTNWSLQMPEIDTQWLLGTEEGDFIVGHDGDQYLTTVDSEYIWASTEVLDVNNEFDHWSAPTRISGRNGIPTEFTEYRFQKNGSPTNAPAINKTDPIPALWTIEMPGLLSAEFLWMVKANKLPNGTLVSAWSTPVRVNGMDADITNQGDPGPFMLFRGAWDNTKVYAGNSAHIDAVRYNGVHYVARIDAGNIPAGTLPTNTDFWNAFVGEFESVATGLLLAELAYIKNLGVHWLRTQESGNRIELKGAGETPGVDDNTLIFYDDNGNQILRIDDDIDFAIGAAGEFIKKAGVRVYHPASGKTAYMTGNGLFSNASSVQFLSAVFGIKTNAAVVGLLTERNTDNNGISAAVVGLDQTSSGNSKSWGGYFNSLKVTGKTEFAGMMLNKLSMSAQIINASGTYDATHTIINTYHTSGTATIKLPTGADLDGLTIIISRRVNGGKTTFSGNGHQILTAGGSGVSAYDTKRRYLSFFIWDGSYWHMTGIS